MQKIKNLTDLAAAAEDAAEATIYENASLISDEAQRETWARNQPVTVLENGNIVEIFPDGRRRIVQVLNLPEQPKITRRKFKLKP